MISIEDGKYNLSDDQYKRPYNIGTGVYTFVVPVSHPISFDDVYGVDVSGGTLIGATGLNDLSARDDVVDDDRITTLTSADVQIWVGVNEQPFDTSSDQFPVFYDSRPDDIWPTATQGSDNIAPDFPSGNVDMNFHYFIPGQKIAVSPYKPTNVSSLVRDYRDLSAENMERLYQERLVDHSSIDK